MFGQYKELAELTLGVISLIWLVIILFKFIPKFRRNLQENKEQDAVNDQRKAT